MKHAHCQEVPNIISQHKVLLESADDVLDLASTREDGESELIYNALSSFAISLKSHIEFENNEFYSKLLQDVQDSAEDTAHVKEFIEEMGRIADVVFAFLDRYDSPQKIGGDIDRFGKDFGRIVGILILRMESEETSVYFIDC